MVIFTIAIRWISHNYATVAGGNLLDNSHGLPERNSSKYNSLQVINTSIKPENYEPWNGYHHDKIIVQMSKRKHWIQMGRMIGLRKVQYSSWFLLSLLALSDWSPRMTSKTFDSNPVTWLRRQKLPKELEDGFRFSRSPSGYPQNSASWLYPWQYQRM